MLQQRNFADNKPARGDGRGCKTGNNLSTESGSRKIVKHRARARYATSLYRALAPSRFHEALGRSDRLDLRNNAHTHCAAADGIACLKLYPATARAFG